MNYRIFELNGGGPLSYSLIDSDDNEIYEAYISNSSNVITTKLDGWKLDWDDERQEYYLYTTISNPKHEQHPDLYKPTKQYTTYDDDLYLTELPMDEVPESIMSAFRKVISVENILNEL